jgi:hypothetical protein
MSDSQKRIEPIVTAAVIAVCVISLALIFMLNADSLVVDLVYQGF